MTKVLCIGSEFFRIAGACFRLFLFGAALSLVCIVFNLKPEESVLSHNWFKMAWDLVGVALVGLVPLCTWMVVLVIKHASQSTPVHRKELMDYEYISTSAPTWGLLGTIIALVMAGAVMAERISAGSSSETILEIIPLVAQALISTVVGLIVQWIADTALHFIERKHA